MGTLTSTLVIYNSATKKNQTYHKLKDKHQSIFGVNNVMKCYNVGMFQLL